MDRAGVAKTQLQNMHGSSVIIDSYILEQIDSVTTIPEILYCTNVF